MRIDLRTCWRYTRWLLLAAWLLFVTWALDAIVTPAPRWTIEPEHGLEVQHWSADGGTFTTIDVGHKVGGGMDVYAGPVTVWNGATGRRIAAYLTAADRIAACRQTDERVHFFCLHPALRNGSAIVYHGDTAAGRVTEHAIPGIGKLSDWAASPRADLLVLAADSDTQPPGRRLTVFELATDTVIGHMPLPEWDAPFFCGREFLVFSRLSGKSVSTVIWNTRTRKPVTLLADYSFVSHHASADHPDEPLLLLAKDAGDSRASFALWDLHRQCWVLRDVGDHNRGSRVVVNRDRALFLSYGDGEDAVADVWDLAADRRIARFPHIGFRGGDLSPDGNLVVVHTYLRSGRSGRSAAVMGVIVFDVDTKEQLWDKYWPYNGDAPAAQFSGDSQTVLVYASSKLQIEALDARTGATRGITHLPADVTSFNGSGFRQNPARTRLLWQERVDRQAFQSEWLAWLQQFLPNGGQSRGGFASVIDSSTGRERLRLSLPESSHLAHLSADGSRLLVYSWNDHNCDQCLRCWDVPSAPPWRSIAGAWLATAACVIAWRWRAGRKTPRAADHAAVSVVGTGRPNE